MIGKHHWLQERLSFAFLVLIQCGKRNYAVTNSMIFFCLVPSTLCLLAPARAQINPDNTLGVESSRVTPNTLINGLPSDQIDGGAQRGSNLFHSFTQFNVNDGQRVFFTNPLDVKNIFTRVTGGQVSNILGTLGVDGNANLFLMNPNGILFGKNASLNVNGSFVATTANGIQFGTLGSFSATNPEVPSSLLTINPSALFFNQINPTASIQNNSIADAGKDPAGIDVLGLRVPDGKSLLLVGGNVSMDGGKLKAYGGRVELGGLTAPGNVNVFFERDNLRLGFPENVNRADVLLTNQAAINVEGAGGGHIAINARNLEVSGRSTFVAGIARGLGTPETVAGDITLNATGEIIVAGSTSRIANAVFLGAKGSGGNITIDTGSLSLRDNAQLVASTLGQGNAGNVTVRAVDAVSLVDSGIFSTVEAGGVGKGGNIDINAATLSLKDGAQLLTLTRAASDTQPAARGDAGNVNVHVTGSVDIAGEKNGLPSGIRSRVQTGTVGNGGNITIDSSSFLLQNGALLTAETLGQGNAGIIKVNAADFFTISGKGANFTSGLFVNSQSTTGTAGDIIVTSPKVTLNNQARLNAESTSGNGGNINLNSNLLLLRRGAQITTNAGTEQKGGDGGNININSKFIVAVPKENSDITANAFQGRGGNINITAQGIFGIEARPKPSELTNDITASSDLGLSGNINLNSQG